MKFLYSKRRLNLFLLPIVALHKNQALMMLFGTITVVAQLIAVLMLIGDDVQRYTSRPIILPHRWKNIYLGEGLEPHHHLLPCLPPQPTRQPPSTTPSPTVGDEAPPPPVRPPPLLLSLLPLSFRHLLISSPDFLLFLLPLPHDGEAEPCSPVASLPPSSTAKFLSHHLASPFKSSALPFFRRRIWPPPAKSLHHRVMLRPLGHYGWRGHKPLERAYNN